MRGVGRAGVPLPKSSSSISRWRMVRSLTIFLLFFSSVGGDGTGARDVLVGRAGGEAERDGLAGVQRRPRVAPHPHDVLARHGIDGTQVRAVQHLLQRHRRRLPPHDVQELPHRDRRAVGPQHPAVTPEDGQGWADGADKEVRPAYALAPEVEQPLPDDRPHLLHHVAKERLPRRFASRFRHAIHTDVDDRAWLDSRLKPCSACSVSIGHDAPGTKSGAQQPLDKGGPGVRNQCGQIQHRCRPPECQRRGSIAAERLEPCMLT